jgi:crotonobetainyl-CoA:carnitine CoA-transferase CaiB-like acyl-CoA transferase
LSNIGEEALGGMGLGADKVAGLNPSLICCSVTGYGGTGPLQGKKSFDMVIQAQTGIMSLTGAAHGDPMKVALSVVDIMSALCATTGAIAALVARERFGYGQIVDTSLLDAGLWMTQFRWPTVMVEDRDPERYGNRSPFHAPHGCFRALDGYCSIAIRDDAHWRSWLRLAGRDSLVANPRYATAMARLAHVEQVEQLVGQWAQERRVNELVEQCMQAGIAAAPVLGLADAMHHAQAAARRMIVTVKSPSAGVIKVLGTPLKISPSEVSVRKAAPELGECNAELERLTQRS